MAGSIGSTPARSALSRLPARRIPPGVIAGLVAASGFGALLLFWLAGEWPTDRGLLDYRAATIGDGLLLPTLVAILAGCLRSPRLASLVADRRWAVAAMAVGLLSGALTQAAWLADNDPVLNWTLPRPHHFNAPGWWHAAFLTAMSGLLPALALIAARRIRAARLVDPAFVHHLAGSPWLGVFFAAAAAFAGLVVVDNGRAAGTNAGQATMVGLGVGAALFIACLGWAFGRELRHSASILALSGAGALALCLALA